MFSLGIKIESFDRFNRFFLILFPILKQKKKNKVIKLNSKTWVRKERKTKKKKIIVSKSLLKLFIINFWHRRDFQTRDKYFIIFIDRR